MLSTWSKFFVSIANDNYLINSYSIADISIVLSLLLASYIINIQNKKYHRYITNTLNNSSRLDGTVCIFLNYHKYSTPLDI